MVDITARAICDSINPSGNRGSVPIHASPAEHQATPDEYSKGIEQWSPDLPGEEGYSCCTAHWHNPEQSGNFDPGWCQYRKMLLGEAVAPLPEGYVL